MPIDSSSEQDRDQVGHRFGMGQVHEIVSGVAPQPGRTAGLFSSAYRSVTATCRMPITAIASINISQACHPAIGT